MNYLPKKVVSGVVGERFEERMFDWKKTGYGAVTWEAECEVAFGFGGRMVAGDGRLKIGINWLLFILSIR